MLQSTRLVWMAGLLLAVLFVLGCASDSASRSSASSSSGHCPQCAGS